MWKVHHENIFRLYLTGTNGEWNKTKIENSAEQCEWYFRHSHSTECPRYYPFTSQSTQNEVWLKINCSFLINQRWIGFRSESFSEWNVFLQIEYHDIKQLWLWQRHWVGYFYEKFKTWLHCFCLLHCSCFGIVLFSIWRTPERPKKGNFIRWLFIFCTQQSSNRSFYIFLSRE